jgi:hypothetical protein
MADVKRSGNGQWEKGASPNPGGRPKKLVEFQQALTDRFYEKALNVLGECLDDPDGKVRIAAMRETFDRIFGKSPQSVTGADGQPLAVSLNLASALAKLIK